MKFLGTSWSIDVLKTSSFVKVTALTLFSLTLLILFTRYSTTYFFLPFSSDAAVSVNASSSAVVVPSPSPPPPPNIILTPPSPSPVVETTGLLDEDGIMTDNFTVGDSSDLRLPEDFGNSSYLRGASERERVGGGARARLSVESYKVCDQRMVNYVPCLDSTSAIAKMSSSEKGEKYERHCADEGKGLNCLVPRPKGYRRPILWPRSRDEVWFDNIPHMRLVEYKGGQNLISVKKDKFVFPSDGLQFIHGADKYLDQISAMVPDIAFGYNTRVALDIGCGVASFGAFLMQRNVTTLSIAPKDIHENQIQFALERGVPAMVAVFATHRMLFPSQAFDLIHCSRYGILLLEVDRLLRAGGYFVWAAQPVFKHEEILQEQWKEIDDLASSICWKLVKKEGYIAIWQKPMNNSCYHSRDNAVHPPLCESNDDPDDVWYVGLKACITQLPSNGYRANVSKWPARLHQPPDRLQSIKHDASLSRKELFHAESKYWNEIIDSYVRAFLWKEYNLRNVMDMRAGFGGFAAALHDLQIDCWVINVVPVNGFNTLPILYDRGLIGVMHDWCEPFDTYPRTYDLLHASGLFSIEKNRKKCNMSTIMLEMDRMLRPGGHVYIRDTVHVINELDEIATAMGWMNVQNDIGEGPNTSWRILRSEKHF
ncbi:probable methyltransferase PMT10 isoform X2 [Arachis ipaensis]|uniref:probable methyltransferase PMT10 isoform X2 n=1 Tax=Arachis ipaensis TaxID=130454 RepID=UPI0007AF080B|nr:probable methyltransferase PMT10 isoform X2 [Arachis ipaensis]XP_025666074.1 probable methyltransferase PMT10 isoform X2 [Arachis hypogaea]